MLPTPDTGTVDLADLVAIADGIQHAILHGDLVAAEKLYAEHLIVWHNYDRVDCDKATSLRTIAVIRETYRELRISDVRRDYLGDGYVQRSVYHVVNQDGVSEAVDTMMRVWVAAGQITRIEEYSDTARVAPPTASEAGITFAPAMTTHDAAASDRLVQSMLGGWGQVDERELTERQEVSRHTARRRQALSALFPGELLVIPTGGLNTRNSDVPYSFRAGSDFAWLVGDLEPDRVLVMIPEGDGHRALVFVRPRAGRSSSAFFADRSYGELWIGSRRGVTETSEAFGIETASLTELPGLLARAASTAGTARPMRAVRGIDPRIDALTRAAARPASDDGLTEALARLRLVKDDFEIRCLQQAVDATVVGFGDVVGQFDAARAMARGERWLEGTFWRRARESGNDVGYGSVVACGPHAAIAHWEDKTGPVRDGDLALLDLGIEGGNLYTADVTRVYPIGGQFTSAQRRVYETVLRAQRAALAEIRPGAAFLDPHRAAMRVIAAELRDWGLLDEPIERVLDEQLHRRWTLHGTSHHLGLDVHDCDAARREDYREGTLRAGMVLTAEPGLYFQPYDDLVPPELRGIGIRIEDDVLVTDAGPQVLSAALPTDPDAVEAWLDAASEAR
jgi:Xaa-Pro aminopeptidase